MPDQYDIVLLLGVLQHLPEASRRIVVKGLTALSGCWVGIRVPTHVRDEYDVVQTISEAGFELVFEHDGRAEGPEGQDVAWLGVFRRQEPAALEAEQ